MVDIKALKVGCGSCSLTELCLPRGLRPDEVEKLDDIVKRRRPLQRGDYLYQAGESFASLFAVRSGSLKTVASASDGSEQILGFHMAGELVGLDAVRDEQHTCSAVALETTSVCEVPYGNLEELSRHVPSLHRQLFRLAGREIGNEYEMLLMLGNRSAEERLATFLWTLGTRLHERGFAQYEFNLTMSRHDIANYLGLAVETVSRLFTQMDREGILAVQRRHITILKPDVLRDMVHLCADSIEPANQASQS
ncbi:MAG: fumarate/nitrate reduction transcriptional regulator Fnr [Gammaproteobacteria bacterium]